jgi:hypothetical protein
MAYRISFYAVLGVALLFLVRVVYVFCQVMQLVR